MINTTGHAYVLLDSWVESVGTVSTSKFQFGIFEKKFKEMCLFLPPERFAEKKLNGLKSDSKVHVCMC